MTQLISLWGAKHRLNLFCSAAPRKTLHMVFPTLLFALRKENGLRWLMIPNSVLLLPTRTEILLLLQTLEHPPAVLLKSPSNILSRRVLSVLVDIRSYRCENWPLWVLPRVSCLLPTPISRTPATLPKDRLDWTKVRPLTTLPYLPTM